MKLVASENCFWWRCSRKTLQEKVRNRVIRGNFEVEKTLKSQTEGT
jgi:hypothetical protein